MQAFFPIATQALDEGLLYAFVALGVWITFRVLSFPDLTVDGTFALGGAVVAVLIVAGMNPFAATVLGGVAGLLAGLCTGLIHTKLRVNGLLAGILMMTALYSVNLAVMTRSNVALLDVQSVFDVTLKAFAVDKLLNSILVGGLLAVAVVLLLTWFLHTHLGLALRATGDNEQMIRGLGVNTDATKLIGLSLGNGLVALSGGLVTQSQGFADVGMGLGIIVVGLASIILGEALIRFRGVGFAMAAVVLGSFIYRLIIALALRAGLGPSNLKLVTAALVLLALVLPLLQARGSGAIRNFDLRFKNAARPIADQDVLPRNG
ncbi:MAG: ABC transporter permease [Chloroflexota bacterium]